MKKALLYMLFLLPLLATAQAPTNSTTQLPSSSAFTPTGWRYKDSTQVQMYNSALSKYYQLVTGKQFNNYIGTATQNAINLKYNKTTVDSLLDTYSTKTYFTTADSGNTITASVLQNANIISVSRSGAIYYPTASTSPTGNYFYNANSEGSIKFYDDFSADGEPAAILYKLVNTTIGGVSAPLLSYNSFSEISFPVGPCFIFIASDETKGDVSYMYFAPSGSIDATQLQAIASNPNTF